MKTLRLFVGLAGLLPALCGDLHAQGDQLYFIPELSDEDLARIDLTDGSVEDWQEIVGAPTLLAGLDFYPRESYDPANFDFQIWLGWHDATDRLYVAMVQVDDFYFNEFVRDDPTPFQDGMMTFQVDGDHSGEEWVLEGAAEGDLTSEEFVLLSDQHSQGYVAIGEVYDSGPHVFLAKDIIHPEFFPAQGPWYALPPYADGGGSSVRGNPAIAVTEFYVTPFDRLEWNSPEESVISDLYPGKTIGLWLSIQDYDQEGKFGVGYSLPQSINELASSWADFVLADPDGRIPHLSVVESVTWARIKALFRE